MDRKLITLAALILAVAVVLGAFGAHGLKSMINERQLGTWEIGVRYQFYHGLAILSLAILSNEILDAKIKKRLAILFFTGVVLFSGSLYLLALKNYVASSIISVAGPLTPIGGIFFIFGWVGLAFWALKTPSK